MDLSEQDLKKIKSLHVMLKMPIWICPYGYWKERQIGF